MNNNFTNILVPELPESVTNATIAKWYKKIGDIFHRDEVLVEIETDKVVLEVPATGDGIIVSILEKEGATVSSRQIIGQYNIKNNKNDDNYHQTSITKKGDKLYKDKDLLSPIIRRLITKHNLDYSNIIKEIKGSGVGGRITRTDLNNYIRLTQQQLKQSSPQQQDIKNKIETVRGLKEISEKIREKRIPMTRIRKCIAERLLAAKNNTAMLTTFNEVNMKPIIDLRKQYGETFHKIHGIRLGFMSFYVKAVVEALKRFPEVNAAIDGEDIIYYNYFDISIAVSTPRGLVTPVLHNVDLMSMADIEKKIKEFAIKGNEGKLTVDELIGGNFTITNGGIFGSLMSTPIINPPQSAILGMHTIKDRPMAVNGEIVILPMMYLALSYDHRLIDGRESVSCLLMIKNIIEDPARLLLEV
ncbi:MAG: 2-oxoglutarate dehydrogenase complex dihydrolipoyllysine-residue succinyltransferase [Candidatus Dasytiphilus stammeri]